MEIPDIAGDDRSLVAAEASDELIDLGLGGLIEPSELVAAIVTSRIREGSPLQFIDGFEKGAVRLLLGPRDVLRKFRDGPRSRV